MRGSVPPKPSGTDWSQYWPMTYSALKDRHNAVEVNWIDPNNGWETATELVEDTQAIARYGRNVTK
ncbi:phage tail protein, partial [Escherichia coli]|uniref:phage tail protein n=1 Tax=Escherichia coli TaxID=562 RepID=UPI0032D8E139